MEKRINIYSALLFGAVKFWPQFYIFDIFFVFAMRKSTNVEKCDEENCSLSHFLDLQPFDDELH